jgi:hypothetical protein
MHHTPELNHQADSVGLAEERMYLESEEVVVLFPRLYRVSCINVGLTKQPITGMTLY